MLWGEGQCFEGRWYYDCKPPILTRFQDTKKGLNKGKWYYRCQYFGRKDKTDCDLFLWAEDAQKRQHLLAQNGMNSEPLKA